MLRVIRDISEALMHLAYPRVCELCGTDLSGRNRFLCTRCLSELPETNFHLHSGNPVEKIFWGRLPVTHASAQYYFTRESAIQHLMHQFKYKQNKDLGHYLGNLMGNLLSQSNRFIYADALIPLPLFASKERKRGYNQATVLCQGIAEVLNIPVWSDVVVRRSNTETQTRKGRIARWQNMEDRFVLVNPEKISNRHLILVDDVVTTGATLEACGKELLKGDGTQLSIATLCFSSR